MRSLGSAVLAFEVIISILFIPAALQNSTVQTSTVLALSLTQIVLAILAMGTLGKSYGVYLGYITQISIIAAGFIVSWMFVLGLIFLGLWVLALRIGRRTDEIKASKNPA